MNEKHNTQAAPLRNPSQMDTYVHVTSPRIWLIAVALFMVMASLAFWGFFGRIPQYYETTGVGAGILIPDGIDGEKTEGEDGIADPVYISMVYCLVDPSLYNSKQLDGKKANVIFNEGTAIQGVTFMEKGAPYSRKEIEEKLKSMLVDDDWVISSLKLDRNKYWFFLMIELNEDLEDLYWGATCSVSIVTHEDAPISYLFPQQQ